MQRFDVVMPLYNKAEFVEAAVRSVLVQPELHELIVVDDGSTDDGAKRVEQLARQDARVRLLRQANAGVSSARNLGVLASTAEYVAFLDADDLYLPDFLAQMAALAAQYPDAGLLGTGYARFSGDAGSAQAALPRASHLEVGRLIPEFFLAWSSGSFICASSIGVKRQALLQLGTLFPVGERLGEDQDVWFRMAERYPVAAARRMLAMYRVAVPGSLTASTVRAGLLPCYHRLMVRVEEADYPKQHLRGARRMLAVAHLNAARELLKHGRRCEAVQLIFNRAAVHKPSYWIRVAMGILLPTGWVK